MSPTNGADQAKPDAHPCTDSTAWVLTMLEAKFLIAVVAGGQMRRFCAACEHGTGLRSDEIAPLLWMWIDTATAGAIPLFAPGPAQRPIQADAGR